MSPRRKGRELALQILFQWDIHHETSAWLDDFWAGMSVHAEARRFAEELVKGVMAEARELDALIGRYAENWTVSRMAFIDRAVLRMAVYEFLHMPDVPARVTLNEAIEIVKSFGDDQSGSFVNGILDRILRDDPRLRVKAQEMSPPVAHD